MRKVYLPPNESQPPVAAPDLFANDFVGACITPRFLDELDPHMDWRLGRHCPATPAAEQLRSALRVLVQLQRELDAAALSAGARSNLR